MPRRSPPTERKRGDLGATRTTPHISMRPDPELLERLDEFASRWECSRTEAVRRLVMDTPLPRR